MTTKVKIRKITVQQLGRYSDSGALQYRVVSTVNTIGFRIGDRMRTQELSRLVENEFWEVTVI